MGAVATGARFIELARLHYCVGIKLCFRGLLVLGFRRFLFVLSRVGLEQFFVVFLLWGFPAGLPQLFVRTVVAGDGFVGLARLNFFVSRWVCATFVSDFCFRVLLSVWLSQFFLL